MIAILKQIFENTLARLAQHLITYVPPLIVAVTMIIAAFLLAGVVRWLILKVVKATTLDRFLKETGLCSMLDRSGQLRGASLVAGVCYWSILVFGFLTALDVFDTTLTSRIVEATVFSVPKLITAAAILLGGFWLAQYLGRSALIWAVNEGLPIARRLATGIRIAVIFVAVVVAADALNFASHVFFTAFAIVMGSAALAASITVGLGLRGPFERYLSQPSEKPAEEDRESVWHHL